jgi:hypothetical protein
MFYFHKLTIPHLTLRSAPAAKEITLPEGKIDYVEVEFPTRCVGLAHVVLYDSNWQIIPWNSDESLYGDGRTFRLNMFGYSITPPSKFNFIGWNYDDTYDHTVSIGFEIDETPQTSLKALLMEG